MDRRTEEEKSSDSEKRTERETWNMWWSKIRSLSDIRRSLALTKRCKECKRGSLDNIKVKQKGVEWICNDCK
jgi:hypothetical protein